VLYDSHFRVHLHSRCNYDVALNEDASRATPINIKVVRVVKDNGAQALQLKPADRNFCC
jgi:hypothetical protein